MATKLQIFLKRELDDLVRIIVILIKELVLALAIVGSGRVIELVSMWISDGHSWSTAALRSISDLCAILAFVALAAKDLWGYFRER